MSPLARGLGVACLALALAVAARAEDTADLSREILKRGTGEQRLEVLQRLAGTTADNARLGREQPLKIVPTLLQTLDGTYELPPGTRDWPRVLPEEAAIVLGNIGAPAVESVVRLLEVPRPRTRFYAARALGRMGPDGSAALPALCAAARTSPDRVRVAVFEAMAQIGLSTEGALETTIAAVSRSTSVDVRIAAAEALGAAHLNVPKAAATLTMKLPDLPVLPAAWRSLNALGKVGADVMMVGWTRFKPKERVAILQELVRLTDPRTPAIDRIESDPLQERLVVQARTVAKDAEERRLILILAGRQGILSDDEIADLRVALRSGDDQRVSRALRTLAQMPDAAEPMIGELIILLDRTNLGIVEYTLTLLANMGAAARPAVPAIARTARTHESLEAKAKAVIVVIQRGGSSRGPGR